MRFPADESCDFAVVRALRDVGHDVTAVAIPIPSSCAATGDALALLAEVAYTGTLSGAVSAQAIYGPGF